MSALSLRVDTAARAAMSDVAVRIVALAPAECALDLASVRLLDGRGEPVEIGLALPLHDELLLAPAMGTPRLAWVMREGEERTLRWRLFSDPLSRNRQPARRAIRLSIELPSAGILRDPASLQAVVLTPAGSRGQAALTLGGETVSWALPERTHLSHRGFLSATDAILSLSWSVEPGPPQTQDLRSPLGAYEHLRDGLGRRLAAALTDPARTDQSQRAAWDQALHDAMSALLASDPVTAVLGAQQMAWLAGGLRLDAPGLRGPSDPPSPARQEVPPVIAAAVRRALAGPMRPAMLADTPRLFPGNEWLATLPPPPAHDVAAREAVARLAARLDRGEFRPSALGAVGLGFEPLPAPSWPAATAPPRLLRWDERGAPPSTRDEATSAPPTSNSRRWWVTCPPLLVLALAVAWRLRRRLPPGAPAPS